MSQQLQQFLTDATNEAAQIEARIADMRMDEERHKQRCARLLNKLEQAAAILRSALNPDESST